MITVILNVYKRPHTLEKQIEAIKAQTVKIPDENIWIWYNKSDVTQPPPKNPKHRTFRCNVNTKFHGRFSAAMLAQTEYVVFFDDDIIPGKKWLENCLTQIKIYNGIMGGSGVILLTDKYNPNQKIGWNGLQSNKTEEVDLVGHSIFLKRDWLNFFWMEKHASYDNGEDISLSYLCQKKGIKTFVPPHPLNDESLWSSNQKDGFKYGNDENASWLKNIDHSELRDKICETYIKNGWQRVNK
jgi:hypothetical protein